MMGSVRFLTDRGFVTSTSEPFYLAVPEEDDDVAGADRMSAMHPRLQVVLMVSSMTSDEVIFQ